MNLCISFGTLSLSSCVWHRRLLVVKIWSSSDSTHQWNHVIREGGTSTGSNTSGQRIFGKMAEGSLHQSAFAPPMRQCAASAAGGGQA